MTQEAAGLRPSARPAAAAQPPQRFFQARGQRWGHWAEFTGAKCHRPEGARDVATKSFLLKYQVAGGPSMGSWLYP